MALAWMSEGEDPPLNRVLNAGVGQIKVHPGFWCKPDFLLFIMNVYQAAVYRSYSGFQLSEKT